MIVRFEFFVDFFGTFEFVFIRKLQNDFLSLINLAGKQSIPVPGRYILNDISNHISFSCSTLNLRNTCWQHNLPL